MLGSFTAPPPDDLGALAASSAILKYAAYLKRVYKSSPISPDSKWPPTPGKKYVQLAVAVKGHSSCQDEDILRGDVDRALDGRKNTTIDQILRPCEGEESLRLVLIEGAPGIGKSALAWELCRKCESVEQYRLAILLTLMEKRVQQIANAADLFFSYETGDQQPLVDEVMSCHGKGVLFVLDGFDELPVPLQREGYLIKLIKKKILTESTVVVTSRPSATAGLLAHCRPLIQKHMEILGFTQESVQEYALYVFATDLKRFKSFKNYILASRNPAISHLMYVPINAAIIAQIHSESISTNFMPHNLTQLYTKLCLTILNKYMKLENPSTMVRNFKDLPLHLYKSFLELAKIAFEGIKTQHFLFFSDDVPANFQHFGFLNTVSTLCGKEKFRTIFSTPHSRNSLQHIISLSSLIMEWHSLKKATKTSNGG